MIAGRLRHVFTCAKGIAAAVALLGCTNTPPEAYPTLKPLEDLLAEADSAFASPAQP